MLSEVSQRQIPYNLKCGILKKKKKLIGTDNWWLPEMGIERYEKYMKGGSKGLKKVLMF